MKKALNIEIGARVREARERLHMSREALAELLNISTLFLSYIECGQKGMSMETLIRVCKTLSVSADYILLGKSAQKADRSNAERLLHDIPDAYSPLSEDTLRLLLRTIATVRAGCEAAPAGKPVKKVRIAARGGDPLTLALTPEKEGALDEALAALQKEPTDFSD